MLSAPGRQLAAPEAVAPVRRQRPADGPARGRLRLGQRVARQGGARDVRVRVVGALGARLGVPRIRHLVGIALVTPVTIVVAGPAVGVPVAIHGAGRTGLTGDAPVIPIFGVVAGTEAVRILPVEEPVTVVVEGVAALVRVVLTGRLHDGPEPTCVAARRAAAHPCSGARRPAAHARAGARRPAVRCAVAAGGCRAGARAARAAAVAARGQRRRRAREDEAEKKEIPSVSHGYTFH